MTHQEKLNCREMAISVGLQVSYVENRVTQYGISPSDLIFWVSGQPEKWEALRCALVGHQDKRNTYLAHLLASCSEETWMKLATA